MYLSFPVSTSKPIGLNDSAGKECTVSVLQKEVCSLETWGMSTNTVQLPEVNGWKDGMGRGKPQSSGSREQLPKKKTFQ